jgi:hypothetical protein
MLVSMPRHGLRGLRISKFQVVIEVASSLGLRECDKANSVAGNDLRYVDE